MCRSLDPCQSHPCSNGGSCARTALGSFTCLCQPYYTGETCARREDPCKLNPCLSGETCVLDTKYPLLYRCESLRMANNAPPDILRNRSAIGGKPLDTVDMDVFDYANDLDYQGVAGEHPEECAVALR